ncbi:hypothetical protein BN1184_BS_01110 [Pantoea ananatis]|nr:hypothetical protein BN1184_BS_01110 [Pantoea ananatis]
MPTITVKAFILAAAFVAAWALPISNRHLSRKFYVGPGLLAIFAAAKCSSSSRTSVRAGDCAPTETKRASPLNFSACRFA